MNTAAMTLPEKVVEYIGYSSAALEKAAAVVTQADRIKQARLALIPSAIDALVASERINPDQREKAAQVLADPVETLKLLVKVAQHRNAQELGHLGTPVNGMSKTAGAIAHDPSTSLSSPHVGRRTTMVKQSDVNLFSRLGLTPPSE